ncbi:MAG: DUF1501 domain-containing protein [Paludisphaera borealis]|uniref:DUF1501 domain-containing protein n=1 Tax=Paludisphaera borealis TaxID=1387353 RepID=UPI002841C171|nr:DUF1501 domain-containing protein [Paludisphaera borealis]MDR3621459.1 DUF1501 domain-containing protein [Paludisphaera borealis]
MIRVLGGRKQLCDGLTRRDLLQVGSLGMLGAALGGSGGVLAREAGSTSSLPGFGQAKSCIMLFMYGSPSQIETFDPKPDAPVAIRGEFGHIPSSVPGLDVCERLPHLAQVMDKVTVLRSVSHLYPVHGVAYATTGNPVIPLAMELNPRDPAHWPYIGSVVDFVDGQRAGSSGGPPAVPRNMALPFAFSSQRIGEVARAGPYGGFLGQAYDPIYTEFVGKGTTKASKTLAKLTWDDFELYRGVTPESRFQLGASGGPGATVTVDQLDRRRSLLQQLEEAHRKIDSSGGPGVDRNRAMAYQLLQSAKFRQAFDLDLETFDTRALYGMTLFGQATLTARRLVEVGGRFVTVFWDEYGLAGTGWDTHWDHFPRMKDELLPGIDRTLSGLLLDLDRRGTLDETLVVLLSEHGRTPQIGNVQGGGRDHWSRCYSVVMAGGGVGRGRVVGKSDKIGSDPLERRVSPKDILATIYHLLGIDPATMIADRLGRPIPLVHADVIPEVLA